MKTKIAILGLFLFASISLLAQTKIKFSQCENPFGTNDSTSIFIKVKGKQFLKFSNPGDDNSFTWYQNSAIPQSKFVLRSLGTTGFSVAAMYLGTPNPGNNNYFAWSDSSIMRLNGVSTLQFLTSNVPWLSGTAGPPSSTGYVTFSGINTATATLTGNKTHVRMVGCTWGFNGTPTITPTKVLISADTYSANSVATITTAITLDVGKPVAGASITITNPLSARFTGNTNTNGLASFGASILTPSATIHVGGQTTTNAHMFFATGSLLTNTVTGMVEFNTGQMYVTNSTNRYKVGYFLTASGTMNFPSTAAGAVADLTITCTGAALNDPVIVGEPNGSVTATGTFKAWVSAADVITCRFLHTHLVNAEDPASGTFKFTVNKN